MSRINTPIGDNGGKNAWRKLNAEELFPVAVYAAENGRLAAIRHFGLSDSTIARACRLAGLKPAPHKRLDLSAVAKAAKSMSRADVAAKFHISESTVTRAKQMHRRAAA